MHGYTPWWWWLLSNKLIEWRVNSSVLLIRKRIIQLILIRPLSKSAPAEKGISLTNGRYRAWCPPCGSFIMMYVLCPGAHFTNGFFARNSNSMETSPCHNSIAGHQIVTNFCTCHDSTAVVPCTKFRSDHCIIIEVRVKGNFHRNRTAMEKPLVKRAPAQSGDAIWRHRSWSILFHVMVCRLFGAKALPAPVQILALRRCFPAVYMHVYFTADVHFLNLRST